MKNFQKKCWTFDEAGMVEISGGTMRSDPAYLVGYLVSFGVTCLIKSVAWSYDNYYPVVFK